MIYDIKGLKIFVQNEILSPGNSDFANTLIERLKNEEWESEEYEMLHSIPKDCTVLELGACIGFISCATNRLISNKKNHVVIEANPELIKTLEKNKSLNNSGFIIKNCIVSESDKPVNFFIDKRSIVGSSLAMSKNRIHKSVEVSSITIKQLEEQNNLNFDAIICDIEGGEYDLFLSDMMKRKLPELRFISIEFHWNVSQAKTKCDKIISMIEESGFDTKSFRAKTGQIQLFAIRR